MLIAFVFGGFLGWSFGFLVGFVLHHDTKKGGYEYYDYTTR